MKKIVFILILVLCRMIDDAQVQSSINLTDQQILSLIEKNRPSKSLTIPADLKNRLGATHMDGQYCFTKEPYIIEGAKKMNELGYGILKLWFAKSNGNAGGYKYNSDWKLTKTMSLKELAEHPYYKQVFLLPFDHQTYMFYQHI